MSKKRPREDKLREKEKFHSFQLPSNNSKKDPSQDNLFPLIEDRALLRSTYAKRRDHYVYQSIHPADQQKYEDDGWEVHKGGNQKVRIKCLRINNLVKYVNFYCLELCSSNRHETV